MKKRMWALLAALIFTGSALVAQDEYQKKEYISKGGDTLRYRTLEPETVIKGQKYPLVVFLHGAGERGNDNEKQLIHGSGMFTNPVHREKYPAYVVMPQCPEGKRWANTTRPGQTGRFLDLNPELTTEMAMVLDVIKNYLQNPNVDPDRVYVMGLSMGGMGTFDLVCRHPELVAAAVPICGAVNPERLQRAAGKVAFSIYHGDKDDSVPVQHSRDAYRALRKYNADVRYHEFVGCKHNSWDPAFNQPDFLEWLFSQRNKK